MEKDKDRGVFTKVLAVTGTLLIWVPITFTVLTSIAVYISEVRWNRLRHTAMQKPLI